MKKDPHQDATPWNVEFSGIKKSKSKSFLKGKISHIKDLPKNS